MKLDADACCAPSRTGLISKVESQQGKSEAYVIVSHPRHRGIHGMLQPPNDQVSSYIGRS